MTQAFSAIKRSDFRNSGLTNKRNTSTGRKVHSMGVIIAYKTR